jgi:hypothetical protein
MSVKPSTEGREAESDPFKLRADSEGPPVHVYGKHMDIVCATEGLGRPKNRELNINELVVGMGNTIPLWAEGVKLYWRFQPRSFGAFADPDRAKARIRSLMGKALDLWGDAAPIAFEERNKGWDFEIVLSAGDNCSPRGCVLASAFFPDGGRHRLMIYPRMLQQVEQEQIETLVHEIGHMFGLRHFFAQVSEQQLASQIFGTHVEFSIMNYGANSYVTDADRNDLKELYRLARSGTLRAINGTEIKLMRPLSAIGF